MMRGSIIFHWLILRSKRFKNLNLVWIRIIFQWRSKKWKFSECLATKRSKEYFYLNENEYKWLDQFFSFCIDLDRSLTSPREPGRKSVEIPSTCRRKRRVILLIAAVKERGNGTKMLYNQHPIKALRIFPLFFFFLSLGIRKNEMDRMGSCFEREEKLSRRARGLDASSCTKENETRPNISAFAFKLFV